MKYKQDLPISFAYLFAWLLSFQSSIVSYCSNKVISAYVYSVAQFSSILEQSKLCKIRARSPNFFCLFDAQLLSFQSSIVSYCSNKAISAYVCSVAQFSSILEQSKLCKIRARSPNFFCLFVCSIAQFSIILELSKLCKIRAISNISCTCRSWGSFQLLSRCQGGSTYFVVTLKIMQYHLFGNAQIQPIGCLDTLYYI